MEIYRKNIFICFRFLVGYILMFTIYFGIKAAIGFGNTNILQTLLPYFGLYGIGFPIFLYFTKDLKSTKVQQKQKLSLSELAAFLILQTGVSGILIYIASNLFNLAASSVTDFNIYDLLVSLLLAPIMEEIVFRKVMFLKLSFLPDTQRVLAVSLLFAIPHIFTQGIVQLICTFFLSWIWCYVFSKTNEIKYPIGLHLLLNLWMYALPMAFTQIAFLNPVVFVYTVLAYFLFPILALVILIRRFSKLHRLHKSFL